MGERAIGQLWDQARKGAEFEQTMSRLNRQMGAYRSTAQSMVGDMQHISDGQISIAQAATMASRALAVGLNPEQVTVFTAAAEKLGDVMGTDIPSAFDNIVQASITGRSAVLANIGIFVDLDEEVKKLAVSTGRTSDQITKYEKAMLATKAINQQSAESFSRLSDGALSDADRLDQVVAKWGTFWTRMQQLANVSVQQTILSLDSLFDYVTTHPGKFLPGGSLLKTLPSKEFFGPPNPGNLGVPPPRVEPLKPLPTSLRGSILDADRERRDRGFQGDLERTKASLEAQGSLFDNYAQRQRITLEELSQFKTDQIGRAHV